MSQLNQFQGQMHYKGQGRRKGHISRNNVCEYEHFVEE